MSPCKVSNPRTSPSWRKVTTGKEEEEKNKMPLSKQTLEIRKIPQIWICMDVVLVPAVLKDH